MRKVGKDRYNNSLACQGAAQASQGACGGCHSNPCECMHPAPAPAPDCHTYDPARPVPPAPPPGCTYEHHEHHHNYPPVPAPQPAPAPAPPPASCACTDVAVRNPNGTYTLLEMFIAPNGHRTFLVPPAAEMPDEAHTEVGYFNPSGEFIPYNRAPNGPDGQARYVIPPPLLPESDIDGDGQGETLPTDAQGNPLIHWPIIELPDGTTQRAQPDANGNPIIPMPDETCCPVYYRNPLTGELNQYPTGAPAGGEEGHIVGAWLYPIYETPGDATTPVVALEHRNPNGERIRFDPYRCCAQYRNQQGNTFDPNAANNQPIAPTQNPSNGSTLYEHYANGHAAWHYDEAAGTWVLDSFKPDPDCCAQVCMQTADGTKVWKVCPSNAQDGMVDGPDCYYLNTDGSVYTGDTTGATGCCEFSPNFVQAKIDPITALEVAAAGNDLSELQFSEVGDGLQAGAHLLGNISAIAASDPNYGVVDASTLPATIAVPSVPAGSVLTVQVSGYGWLGYANPDGPEVFDGVASVSGVGSSFGPATQVTTPNPGSDFNDDVFFLDVVDSTPDSIVIDFPAGFQPQNEVGVLFVTIGSITNPNGTVSVADFNIGAAQQQSSASMSGLSGEQSFDFGSVDMGDCPAVVIGGGRHGRVDTSLPHMINWVDSSGAPNSASLAEIDYDTDIIWDNSAASVQAYQKNSFNVDQCSPTHFGALIPGGSGAQTFGFNTNQNPGGLGGGGEIGIVAVPIANCEPPVGSGSVSTAAVPLESAPVECDGYATIGVQGSATLNVPAGASLTGYPVIDGVRVESARFAFDNSNGGNDVSVTLPVNMTQAMFDQVITAGSMASHVLTFEFEGAGTVDMSEVCFSIEAKKL